MDPLPNRALFRLAQENVSASKKCSLVDDFSFNMRPLFDLYEIHGSHHFARLSRRLEEFGVYEFWSKLDLWGVKFRNKRAYQRNHLDRNLYKIESNDCLVHLSNLKMVNYVCLVFLVGADVVFMLESRVPYLYVIFCRQRN